LLDADLTGARLSRTFLQKTNLVEPDLSGVVLTGAIMPDGSRHP